MAEPTEPKEAYALGIWIDFPANMSPWLAPYVVAGHYSTAYGDAKVKCVVDHPNGTTYSRGPFDVSGGTYSTQFTTLPPTPPGQEATLTAYLYSADGTTELAHYSIFVVIA
ncbi:MAG: hypothetical protein HYS12_19165 [Planctomycetes bacterium]|nr:hypothetical protein [Planctomycetota bacterium]